MTEAFYTRMGDLFTPTPYASGPWDPKLSHGGPPAALLLDAIAKAAGDKQLARFTVNIPRGVPLAPLRVTVREIRGGRKVTLLAAELTTAHGDPLMDATAWAMRTTDDEIPRSDPHVLDLAQPMDCTPITFDLVKWSGYFDATETRIARGAPFEGGPAAMWIRSKVPLVHGEAEDPYAKLALFGDLGNGTSRLAPFEELMAINTDISLHLSRRPESDWIALDSKTISHGMGLGISDTLVYDATGFVARANQSIFFDRL